MSNKKTVLAVLFAFFVLLPRPAYAMHIAEGFLPLAWSIVWTVAFLPFLVWGINSVKRQCQGNQRVKMVLALVGAYCFVLSALKIPSVTGSSSHPTGIGLGTIIFGPAAMSVVGIIVLLFQALLLAHGGISTLGANAFSMAVAGPFVGYGCFLLAKKCKASLSVCVFISAMMTDLFTYIVTSVQLALAFNTELVSFGAALGKFLSVFAVTQLPLAIIEGILAVIVYKVIMNLCSEELTIISNRVGRVIHD